MPDPVPARWRAYVCCGPRCTERRSPALIDVLQREVDRAGLRAEVEVLPGGCQKHCERGPSLVIWPGPIHYEQIDTSRLRRIVRDHLRDGCPVRDLLYREPTPAPTAPRTAVTTPIAPRPPITVTPPSLAAPPRSPRPGRPARPPREVDDFSW